MKVFKILFLVISIISANKGMSQIIASHQWENRVLLVLSDGADTSAFQNQIKELQAHENGLTDRKLIVYQIKKQNYTKGLADKAWQTSSKTYKKYKSINASLEVVLIGLDGGIKLRQAHLLNCEKLFETIDVMPMRKSELKLRSRQ
ncbi:DUF4174 domain-containing protein [Algibacter pectinivorans]|uniref:DUF4174 domain-containing protein n=1 Tax=Algibacter pectinivorans TaxID=870482 RepID=A0A1I1PM54_9FLAO|nr:DUF4174 domain-containing protein [Algibacter pectinivorans]SFD10881.1 protein of unknown function [Algibacter pectinivorans]